ncbi:MAG: DUF4160 domain-containing protein [Treponema sp.]|nr:DUF4160 domain-containing protein [Treponema sp.]
MTGNKLGKVFAVKDNQKPVFSFKGEIIEDTISNSKKKLVEAWIEIHKEELMANWKLLDEGEEFFKIEPLK